MASPRRAATPGLAASAGAPDGFPGWRRLPGRGNPLAPTIADDVALVATLRNVGLAGYGAGPRVHVVDRLGLGDPIAARLRPTARGRPGHEKYLGDPWVVARFAEPAFATTPEAVAAREALACDDLSALRRAVEEPLTVHRFLANVRLAWTLRGLRIPPDPVDARAALCGQSEAP